MKTIDGYVIKGLANENLDLLIERLSLMKLNLDVLVNGVPQSATITNRTDVVKLKERLLNYIDTDEVVILSTEVTDDFYIRIKYSYKRNNNEVKSSTTFSPKEAEEYNIEIKYV